MKETTDKQSHASKVLKVKRENIGINPVNKNTTLLPFTEHHYHHAVCQESYTWYYHPEAREILLFTHLGEKESAREGFIEIAGGPRTKLPG